MGPQKQRRLKFYGQWRWSQFRTGSSFLDIDISSNRGRARSEQAKRVFLAELVARRNENGAR